MSDRFVSLKVFNENLKNNTEDEKFVCKSCGIGFETDDGLEEHCYEEQIDQELREDKNV